MFEKRKIEKLLTKTFSTKWKYGTDSLFLLSLTMVCPDCKEENDCFFNGKIITNDIDPEKREDPKPIRKCSCGHEYTEKEIFKAIENSFPEDERTIKEKMLDFILNLFIGEEFGNVERTFNILFAFKILFFIAVFVIGIHFLIKYW
jgi:hypothetical protein